MTMNPLRPNVGIAIDGGGIKGLIIARALKTLEDELGGKPLISHAPIKILSGTSTGAILTGSLSIGMDAATIADMYEQVGRQVFHRLTPGWLGTSIQHAAEFVLAVCRHSVYSNKKLMSVLRDTIKKQTGTAEFTLANLNEQIGPDRALILTTVDITERRTHFLKSYSERDGQWPLWEAILASASVPPALPVLARAEGDRRAYYTDGGVGSYGNPAYVVAQEATAFRGYRQSEVSILSFGTGWLNAANFERQYHAPTTWRGLDWAKDAPSLFIGDTIRAESVDILENPATSKIDFRRFQFELTEDIASDSYGTAATYERMKKLGDELGVRIANNQFASKGNPQWDPEGIFKHQARYRAARHS